MYIPRHNEEKRVPVLHALMRAQSFGTLVTSGRSGLVATHLPIMLEQDGSAYGVLKCHVSRANSQWREFDSSVEAMAIFAGDHHYVSASWYPEAANTGAEVPTWNYVVVHAYGTLRVMDSDDELHRHLETLTDMHESAFANPWKVSDAPEDFLRTMKNGIVGLVLPIQRLEGKWKVSQNRNLGDQEAVMRGLHALETPESLAMEQLVKHKGAPED